MLAPFRSDAASPAQPRHARTQPRRAKLPRALSSLSSLSSLSTVVFQGLRSRTGRTCRARAHRGVPVRSRLRIEGGHFVDDEDRVVLPRGVNFSGLSKVPKRPDGATHRSQDFYAHRSVSFVGRPCDLQDLEEHLQRLKAWGFNLLRLVITWEAVNHEGPGIYDEEYLQFLRSLCERAGESGFWILVDPHQDCWSRWTGGDGAPGWTLEAAGFKVGPELHSSGAAFLHQEHGDPLPSMSWPTNYDRLGSATMFSLFWAGDRVAPGLKDKLQGLPLQECLQGGFLGAMAKVARTLRDLPSVLGFETLNEPHPGWLGTDDLSRPNTGPITTGQSPFEQIKRCSDGPWESGCLWAEAGLWLPAEQKLVERGGFQCDWMKECFVPFVEKYTATILDMMPDALIGVCPPAFGRESMQAYPAQLHPQAFWAPHFYDGIVLIGKVWTPEFGIEENEPGEKLFNILPAPPVRPVFGLENRVESYKKQLLRKCELSSQSHSTPSILGEIGLPFDLRPGLASERSESAMNEAADAHMRALEELLLPHCWWNYTPENCPERGDFWNGEDLSIFSKGKGRAPDALIRPYLLRCNGKPISQSFNLREGSYRCEIEAAKSGESVLFVPALHFPTGRTKVSATPGVEVVTSPNKLVFRNRPGRVVIELRRD